MALAPRIELRQSQSLTLTPQLMQSIRLLQLGHLELQAFVETELLRNPLLEREEGEAAVGPEETPEPPLPAVETAEGIAGSYDTEVEYVFPEQTGQDAPGLMSIGRSAHAGDGGESIDFDQFVAARPTLAEHLVGQVMHLLLDPADRLIAPVGDSSYSTIFNLIPTTLAVLREAAGIEPDPQAMKHWYRQVPIAELGYLTAEQLVMLGRTAAVISFIRSVRDGARG